MKRFFFALVTLCLFTVAAFGQSSTSTLSGTVSDASGVIQMQRLSLRTTKRIANGPCKRTSPDFRGT